MIIVPFENQHLEQVVALSLRAWSPVFESIRQTLDPELFDFFYQPDWQTAQRLAVREACQSSELSVWIAVDSGQVVGFVAVKLDTEAKSGEIYMIAVDPAQQRRGFASQLTEFALQHMRDAGMTLATVNTGADPGHTPARRCYEKAGFGLWPQAAYFKRL